LALRWRAIEKSRSEQARQIALLETEVEAATAELRGIEAAQTKKREEQTRATDAFNQVQSDFYARSAEISRLEQALQHSEERKNSLEQDLERAGKELDEMNRLLQVDGTAIEEIDTEILRLEPDFAARDQVAEAATEKLQRA
jgi:chromosome segregation protein